MLTILFSGWPYFLLGLLLTILVWRIGYHTTLGICNANEQDRGCGLVFLFWPVIAAFIVIVSALIPVCVALPRLARWLQGGAKFSKANPPVTYKFGKWWIDQVQTFYKLSS
jgi:hypothetical protein